MLFDIKTADDVTWAEAVTLSHRIDLVRMMTVRLQSGIKKNTNLILLSTFCAEPPDARDSVARDIDCDGTQEGSMLPSLVASINHKSGYDGVGCIDVRFVDSHTAPYDQQSLKHIIDLKH